MVKVNNLVSEWKGLDRCKKAYIYSLININYSTIQFLWDKTGPYEKYKNK